MKWEPNSDQSNQNIVYLPWNTETNMFTETLIGVFVEEITK